MTTDVTAVDVALKVAIAIEAVGGAYFVGGSLASSLHGEPRATNDMDMVLDRKNPEFTERLGSDFEVDIDALKQALLSGASCNIFYLPHLTKIDLFGVGPTAYDEIEFSRRRAIAIRPDVRLVVRSPEDTVVRKLWFRHGGDVSDRQWRDVVQVLALSGPELDDAYMERWTRDLGISDLLEKARAQAASAS